MTKATLTISLDYLTSLAITKRGAQSIMIISLSSTKHNINLHELKCELHQQCNNLHVQTKQIHQCR